jgi:hypothetical protein
MRPPLSVALTFACLVISSPDAVAQWAGEWKLDEKSGTAASDSSGNANHGTLKNFATTPSPWVAGKFGNALLFDGVDDYVDIGIKKGLPAYDGRGSPYSIVFWVKAPAQHDKRCYAEGYSKAATGYGAIITFGSGRTSNTTTDKFQVFIRNDAGGVVCNGYSAATVFDDKWHHVVWTDSSGTTAMYIDGVKDTNTIQYGANMQPGAINYGKYTLDRAAIGAVLRQGACCLMKGALDDVRVYHFALSVADVQLVMLNVPKIPCSASVGRYGHGCSGTLALQHTGTAQYGKTLNVQLTGGTASANAMLFVGVGVSPLDLSPAGFAGCVAYPNFLGSILVGIGKLNTSGSSVIVPIPMPTQTIHACAIGVVQGVAISGAKLELSNAVLVQLGK